MNKLIIHHDIDDLNALYYAMKVVQQGKISEDSEGGLRYCYITTFTDDVRVYAHVTKAGTPVFHVLKNKLSV